MVPRHLGRRLGAAGRGDPTHSVYLPLVRKQRRIHAAIAGHRSLADQDVRPLFCPGRPGRRGILFLPPARRPASDRKVGPVAALGRLGWNRGDLCERRPEPGLRVCRWFSPFPVAVKNTNILGALLCGGVATWIVCRRLGLSFWRTMDQVIPAVPLAQAIGRLGCFANGCCYGRPTQSSLGLFLPDSDGHWARRYPTQLLFVAANLLIFFILLAAERWAKRRGGEGGHWPFDGFLTLLYLGLYLTVRASLDFLRGDAMPAWIGPLNSTQVAAIVGLILVLAAGLDRKELAQRAADMVLQEVLDDGFFHADPHPGNMLIMDGGVIGMLDFGTMGRIEKSERAALARLFLVAVQMDVDGIVDQLIRMGVADYSVDRKGLGRDLRRSIMRYYGLPLNQIPAMEVWEGLEPIIYEYNLRVPSDYWLLIKTVVIMEGVGLGLDPEFDMVAAAQPYLGRLFRQLWLPSTWGSSLLRMGTDWTDFVSGFPRQSTHILKQLERGDLEIRIRIPNLSKPTET